MKLNSQNIKGHLAFNRDQECELWNVQDIGVIDENDAFRDVLDIFCLAPINKENFGAESF